MERHDGLYPASRINILRTVRTQFCGACLPARCGRGDFRCGAYTGVERQAIPRAVPGLLESDRVGGDGTIGVGAVMLTPDHIARSDNLRLVSDDKREAAWGALIFVDEMDDGPWGIAPEFPTVTATCQQCGAPFLYRKTFGNPRLRCDACVK